MLIRLSRWQERVRGSLFFVPLLFVVAGVALGQVGVAIDRELARGATELPFGLTSTVESARAVLSVIASATITFAGIAFSISLLILQLASSQYSPRVVKGLFRDPFNKRAIGVVIGTFTYCMIVLRAVRGPLEESGEPVIPNISVAIAVVLGLVSILTIVAFINHSAHNMDVSTILRRVTDDSLDLIERTWEDPDDQPSTGDDDREAELPDGEGFVVRHVSSGWVQQIDSLGLLDALPAGTTAVLHTRVGRFAIEGTPLLTMCPPPDEPDAAARGVLPWIDLGETRTLQQDVAYGLRQLADVALKALSPGINDPTTARDAMFHAGTVLHALLMRSEPTRELTNDEGCRLIHAERLTADELVDLTFDQVRMAAAPHPIVCTYLLAILHRLEEALSAQHRHDGLEALRRQAQRVVEGCALAPEVLPADLDEVRALYDRHFGANV